LHIVIVTGPSGSGKTSALHALEDMGYYAVDNLPVPLLTQFVDLLDKAQEASRAAVVIDARSGRRIKEHDQIFSGLRELGHELEVLFLDAPDNVLVRRFSETRRKHPLNPDDLPRGIKAERELLEGLRQEARVVIDTGPHTAHKLKGLIWKRYGSPAGDMAITLASFGFKKGVPHEADMVFDVRFLPNPYFEDELTALPGTDSRVKAYVFAGEEAEAFLEKTVDLIAYLVPLYVKEGKAYLTVATGCTGGRHRSVAVTEALRERLSERGITVSVRHRDVDRT
jgi:UPF0042 nucleotide-binding protein